IFYTELSLDAINVAPFNGGAGGADSRALPSPRPGTGIQDLAFFGGFLYALTGYANAPLEVFKLTPTNGAVVGGPISIVTPLAVVSADGFTVLPNGNFLINDQDMSTHYCEYGGTTGNLIGNCFNVPGAIRSTGVDIDLAGSHLFFATDF